jgi:hypothetical protein
VEINIEFILLQEEVLFRCPWPALLNILLLVVVEAAAKMVAAVAALVASALEV